MLVLDHKKQELFGEEWRDGTTQIQDLEIEDLEDDERY